MMRFLLNQLLHKNYYKNNFLAFFKGKILTHPENVFTEQLVQKNNGNIQNNQNISIVRIGFTSDILFFI